MKSRDEIINRNTKQSNQWWTINNVFLFY